MKIKYFVVLLFFYACSVIAMDEELLTDVEKAWSQLKADERYGNNFLKKYIKITVSRKETEAERFYCAWHLLNNHKEEFRGLQFGDHRVTEKETAKLLKRLAKFYHEIKDMEERDPGKKLIGLRLPLREHKIEEWDVDDSSCSTCTSTDTGSSSWSDTSSSTQDSETEDQFDPMLAAFFDQYEWQETEPLLSEEDFQVSDRN